LEIYQRIGAPEAGRIATFLAEAKNASDEQQFD
jgi:hypothetical protein